MLLGLYKDIIQSIDIKISIQMQGAQTFDTTACSSFVSKEFDEKVLPSLQKYIQIPNVSKEFLTAEEWNTNGWDNLLKAAEHLKNWVQCQSGIKNLTKITLYHDRKENLTPLLYIEIAGTTAQADTYLFYGHYDKQPQFTGWDQGLGPYTPVLDPPENPEKLYGRGGADDGYSTYGSILAIRTLQQLNLTHPRCVFTIEGDEQSGTGDVQKHIANLKDQIGTPKMIFCLDSGTLDYKRLWATTTLRGYLNAWLRIDVLSEGVHSGSSSGIVPNTFRILRSLLERIQNQETGDMSPQLNVDVPPNRYKELYECARLLGEDAVAEFPFFQYQVPCPKIESSCVQTVQRVNENVFQTLLLNGWRAQMAITCITGYPTPDKAGNVMLPYVEAKISIRLPPTIDPKKAQEYFVKTLSQNPPYNAKITLSNVISGEGFNCPIFSESLEKSLQEASKIFYGNQYLTIGQGGSIPFMGYLREFWPKAQFVVTGVLGPKSNAHGPNEFLHIPYVKSLISSMAYIVYKTSAK